jgi:hypothetical protein
MGYWGIIMTKIVTLDIEEVKEQLESLIDKLENGSLDVVYITVDGVSQMVMIPYGDFKSL